MEDVLGNKKPKKVERFFLTNQFNKCCPFFISIGMTYEQFWYEDPTIANMYLEAFKIKEEREAEKIKWITWEQGLYVYEAICEGDDYWIAEDKLQKQVEILERDNTVNVVYTKSKIYLQSKKKFSKEIGGSAYKGYEAQLLKEPIMTLTSIVRINALENYYEEISPDTKGWLMGDTPMWLWMSNHGKIYFMDEVTSVYRHLDNSASHSKSYDALESYNKSLLDIRLYFLDLYPVETPNIKTCIYDDFYRRNIAQALFTNSFHQVFANLGHLSNSNCLDYVKATIKIVIKLVKKQIDKDV